MDIINNNNSLDESISFVLLKLVQMILSKGKNYKDLDLVQYFNQVMVLRLKLHNERK